MSRIALLDVNLLLALFNPKHAHHEVAHDWFADHHRQGWATCTATQNGFVRVLSNPAWGGETFRPVDVVAFLQRFCSGKEHVFWGAEVSLTDTTLFNPAMIRGYRQVTDVYLLGLAKRMNGCLVTFDGGIPLNAVLGATRRNLAILSADE